MIKILDSRVISNNKIAPQIFDMILNGGEIAKNAKPGQFINIYLNKGEFILPRPISICETDGCNLRLIYHLAGKGTEILSEYKSGETIRIGGPLGNGFQVEESKNIALIGGGIGLPPIKALGNYIMENFPKTNTEVFAGFRNSKLIILEKEFEKMDIKCHISTDDGSAGFKGNVLQSLKASGFKPDMIYACGPNIMLHGICAYAQEEGIDCQISLEERMACGFGACVGCAVKIKADSGQGWEYKKVCKDGPVFFGGDVIFNG